MLVLRDLQKQYTKFRLGYLWTLLEPLGMSLVLWLVFSVVLSRSLGEQPYALFITVAILPWWWFTKGIAQCTRAFRKNGGQLSISLLPTELWVLRVVLVTMAEFILSLPIILLAMLVTRTVPGPLIIFFPIAMLLQFILMYGIGLLVSSGVAVIPDLARIVRIVMRALFYLSPVLYSVSKIPDHIQGFAALNPMVGILGLYRIGFWSGEIENPINYVISLAVGLAFVVAGLVVFRRLEPRVLKEA